MKIVIAGGTGLVGKALVEKLSGLGHSLIILTRKAPRTSLTANNVDYVEWMKTQNGNLTEKLDGTDIFINLAGESIGDGRWTNERKSRIVASRLNTTTKILRVISELHKKPKALINASAIGYYGTSETKSFTEAINQPGSDFLATTVLQWEKSALRAEELGVRTVLCRFGVILAKDGGAFPRMAAPYKMFAGGTVGSGRQWVSWIHIDDIVNGIIFAINTDDLRGPVNFTAPTPVTMKEFGKTLSKVIHRPHWLPVPGFALKLLLGEMSTLVVDGQRVFPKVLQDYQFQFTYPDLEAALKNICT